jgi:hypothetical protein
MRILRVLIVSVMILGLGSISLSSAEELRTLPENTTWDKTASPYTITGDLLIPAGVRLTVKPGVKVLMGPNASLVIEGEITALGSADDPILFTSSAQNPSSGDWGNLRFVTADTTLSYDEAGNYIKGSRLEYCVIEYGGIPAVGTSKEFLGGAIHCRKSSPFLRHLTIRFNQGQFGGGVYCHEFASPHIEDCLFLENSATQSGGGLACFFYSNAVVKHNVFHGNQAAEHGGGIYFSFSSPQILDNIIENNTARYQGGGLHGSNTVTKSISRVRGNVLLSNHAGEKAGNIYITAKIETIFQENCLFTDQGYEVYVDALETDLDFSGNYFGPLGAGDLEARVRDRYDDPEQKVLICDPVLEAPPRGLPNAPHEISSLTLAGDAGFVSDWPFPVCYKAPLYIEIKASDRNPYHADWIPVRLRSSESDLKGVITLAWETGPSTGLFRLMGIVEKFSSASQAAIKASEGETVFISIEDTSGFEISRRVDPSQSYITAFSLPNEADSLHIVGHQPLTGWRYRNIFGNPQVKYELQLCEGSVFSAVPLWSSGETQDSSTSVEIHRVELKDGSRYALRLRINSGAAWSEWATMALRLNSLPSVPQLLSPLGDQIVSQEHPTLNLQASTDAENDPIQYEVQLYQDAAFTRVLAIEKELRATGMTAAWSPAIDLKDNAEYFWRARSRDAFEIGAWAQTGHFWMNPLEEPPLPFTLTDPEKDQQVYHLQPVFSWHRTVDPDPLSKVHYRLLICPDEKFTPSATIKQETEVTFLKADRVLKNDATYFWKVEAVDNTNRATPSQTVGRFSVSTTPTAPHLAGPFKGEELRSGNRLAWSKSTDPDPEDSLVYHLQIAENDFSKLMFDEFVFSTEVVIDSLRNFHLLKDDKEYRVRVRAEDDQNIASAWSPDEAHFFMNKVNTAPGQITGSAEPHGTVEINPTPIIAWGPATDGDRSDPASSLSYLLQFDRDGSFREVFRQVQVMAGVTRIAVPGLLDNTGWYYRLCARDDEGAISPWSPVRNFTLNTQNDPPAPFTLVGPEDGLNTYKLTGLELSWQVAGDVDPGDKVHYLVSVVPAAGGSPVMDGKRTSNQSLLLASGLKNETEYIWWVEAVDSLGARTASKSKAHFAINTTPTDPKLMSFVGNILDGKQRLSWNPSTDPDPADQLTYTLQIVKPEKPDAALIEIPKLPQSKAATGLTVTDMRGIRQLKDNQQYAFRMCAVDPHGAISGWAQPLEFTLDIVNEPPARFELVTPTSNHGTPGSPIEFTWNVAQDPDPGDAVRYTLFLAKDIGYTRDLQVYKDLEATRLELNEALEPGATYFWKVLAQDSKGLQAWSSVGENRSARFTLNAEQDNQDRTGELR